MITVLSEKTIERLSRCRSQLLTILSEGRPTAFSHEIASLINASPAQIRQDMMSIGYTGSPGKGYLVNDLIQSISAVLDGEGPVKMVLAGAGSLGKAVLGYFGGAGLKMSVVAAFDTDLSKMDRMICGVPCYPLCRAGEIIEKTGATAGIIATPGAAATQVKDIFIRAGINSILNFSSQPLQVPDNIHVEEMDITVAMEKVIYFGKHSGGLKKI